MLNTLNTLNTLLIRLRTRVVALLKNEAVRERLLATGVFAGLAVFALASFDFIVSGGPNWTPSAQAAPPPLVRVSSLPDMAYAAPRLREIAAQPRLTVAMYPDYTRAGYTQAGEDLLGGPFGDDAPPEYDEAPAWRQDASYTKTNALKPF